MAEELLVRLDIENRTIRREFEEIISSSKEFKLLNSGEMTKCDVLIHEIKGDIKKELQLVQELTASGMVGEFFLTAAHTDPQTLIEALRSGAKEFISQPVNADEVMQCLTKAMERIRQAGASQPQGKQGTIIDVLGSKGGVGTTTTAVNLAAALMQLKEVESVALIDMNLLFGEIPLFMDIKPAFSWAEIARNIERLDASYLMGVLTRHPSGVHVLPPPSQLDGGGVATPEMIEKILHLMREEFDYIVIDSGQSLDSLSLKVLELSDDILLLSILSLPCLINVKKLLETFTTLGYPPPERIKVVINRYHKKSVISTKEAEEGIRRKIYWLIPNDYQTTMSAVNQGKLITEIAKRSEVAKSFHDLAVYLGKKQAGNPKEKKFLSFR
jgi:pilus assembly protein CpaE